MSSSSNSRTQDQISTDNSTNLSSQYGHVVSAGEGVYITDGSDEMVHEAFNTAETLGTGAFELANDTLDRGLAFGENIFESGSDLVKDITKMTQTQMYESQKNTYDVIENLKTDGAKRTAEIQQAVVSTGWVVSGAIVVLGVLVIFNKRK